MRLRVDHLHTALKDECDIAPGALTEWRNFLVKFETSQLAGFPAWIPVF